MLPNDRAASIDLPDDAAVAVVDGAFGRNGAGAGMVFLHGGLALLKGIPVPAGENSWDAEADAVRLALATAGDRGVARLRILADKHDVAMLVQGYRKPGMNEGETALAAIVDAARDSGIAVSVRMVQGHAETADLPSRLNDMADVLGFHGAAGGFVTEMPATDGWIDDLVARDGRFMQTWTRKRWTAFLPKCRAAHFIGVTPETVDELVKAGHLDVGPEGVTRVSAARVYEFAQRERHEAYFGFGPIEGEPGMWDDEIHRGWDGRHSRWYHRKSGLRAPVVEAVEASEGHALEPMRIAS